MIIESKRWDGALCVLVHKESGLLVHTGEGQMSRGAAFLITGGRAPHKSSSSGFVWCKDHYGNTREFYPGVFNMVWVDSELED